MTRPHPAWTDDRGQIVRLLMWMREGTPDIDARTLINVVEKPWHYDDEYRQMCAQQRRDETDGPDDTDRFESGSPPAMPASGRRDPP
jgi:hypothetical protein